MNREEKLRAGKVPVDAPLVERLVAAQFPQWAHLPIRNVEQDGWDNWTFRLGDWLKVRLPSAAGYSEQAEKEARWLPHLAPHLPVPVPALAGVGRPTAEFPFPWSIYQWLEGDPVTRALAEDVRFARDVATFLRALRAIDSGGGPPPGQHCYFRGAPIIAAYGNEARRSVEQLAGRIDIAGASAVLAAADTEWSAAPVWVHGDIAAGNLLVRGGGLGAVIDFGCLAVGDPACDLVLAWVFLEGRAREAFRAAAAADAATWARARGWALWKAMLLMVAGTTTHPAELPPEAVVDAVIDDHRSTA